MEIVVQNDLFLQSFTRPEWPTLAKLHNINTSLISKVLKNAQDSN